MGEATLEIARFQEVVDVCLESVVVRVLPMRPVSQEMTDIGSTGLTRCPNKRWCHLHLVEGLVPDLVQPVGHAHARPNTRKDEIEEEKPHEALGSLARKRLHNGATDIMPHDTDAVDSKRIEKRQHIGRVVVRTERARGLVAVAETAEIRR